jgi:hypothetical protein
VEDSAEAGSEAAMAAVGLVAEDWVVAGSAVVDSAVTDWAVAGSAVEVGSVVAGSAAD